VETPLTTTILGASELTGRLASGTLGLLGALTGEETARTFNRDGLFGREQVAPPTPYGVVGWRDSAGAVAFNTRRCVVLCTSTMGALQSA
jgi:hypothetical protein